MNTLKKTKTIIAKYGIVANKRFGQNFLIDDNILDKIIESSEVTNEDLVIEIGPGLGNLTEYILDVAKYALLVEIDKNMLEILSDRFSTRDNYNIINEDILKIDIDKEVENVENKLGLKFKSVKVIANLPYYITTPIVFKLLQDSSRISDITVMVQKEVADRIVANPKSKDYGILTVMAKYLSESSIQVIVPKESFIPAPNVTSAVIRMKKQKKYKVNNEKLFFDLVHAAFAQRRKKMVNSLESVKFNNMNKAELNELMQKCGVSENARAEELEIEKFIEISNNI